MPSAAASTEGIDLESFEALVYGRRYEEAVQALLAAIRFLRADREFKGQVVDDTTRPALYSRFAAAIGALLCDPLFTLSEEGFDRLAVEHPTLSLIFRASVFESADHLLRHFGTPSPGDPGKLELNSPEGVGRLLMLYSLGSQFEFDFEQAIRFDPRRALPAFLGMLASPIVLSPAHHWRRESLLALGHLFEGVEIRERMTHAMVSAYMCSSYAESRTKHAIKRSFNRMMRRLIESHVRLPSFSGNRESRARPTMLVPVEAFGSRHAMYRCFALVMTQLRERFRLVAIGGMAALDDVSRELFDEAIVLDEGAVNLHDIVASVREVNPDIVYYPSLGMSTNWVALSSVRLAPVQAMTMGHPATSYSEAIDYAFVPEQLRGDPSTLDETTFLVDGTPPMVLRRDAHFPEPEIRERPDILRIAVPSMVAKLNATYLRTCRTLCERSRRPVEFHFFPGTAGLCHYVTAMEIRRWLPEAIVHEAADYNVYLSNLGKCDVHVSTFPFGGANSNLDTMKLCIPMVTLEGLEVHSQTDSGMMRAVGMPEWLIAKDESGYVQAALRLIESDAERVALAQTLREVDVGMVFGDRSGSGYSADFTDAVWFAYSNHELLLSSGRRYWSVADRKQFKGA